MVNQPAETPEESAPLLDVTEDGEELEHGPELFDEKNVAPPALRTRVVQRITTLIAATLISLRSRWDSLRQLSFLSILRHSLYFFLPSFARKATDPDGSKPPVRISSHAHLDGLRGLAALFVFFFHSSYTVWEVRAGFASGGPGEFMSPLRLPFIRLLFSGDAMVSIFYLVSGFVLSIKPVKLMQAGAYETLFISVSSAGFRRGIRLFLPCFVSTFIILICIRLGLFEQTRDFATDTSVFGGSLEWHMYRTDSLWEQIQSWLQQSWNFVHVWEWFNLYAGNTGYDVHLWTIPDEFRCSMVLFLTQMATARGSSRARIITLCALTVFGGAWDRWDMMCFWCGAILAELDVNRLQQAVVLPKTEQPPRVKKDRLRSAAWVAVFILGLYLLSFPDSNPQKTYGYKTLFSLIPPTFTQPNRFWHVIGSVLVAQSINVMKPLQRFFNSSAVTYLGKISFALYLMHGLVLHTFGYSMLSILLEILRGRDSDFMFGVAWFINQCFVTMVVIWAADIFWVNVDVPSTKVCRWVEEKFIGKT